MYSVSSALAQTPVFHRFGKLAAGSFVESVPSERKFCAVGLGDEPVRWSSVSEANLSPPVKTSEHRAESVSNYSYRVVFGKEKAG